jgi:DNA polymerase I-like protein with 3'-5' exonuclease and polymerase domains
VESLLTKGKLPNLRDLIIPDSMNTLIDMDLARADAQVVAWDADAKGLKERFELEKRDPSKDLHTQNAADLFQGKCDKKHRDLSKKIVHASHYLVTARSLAPQAGILVVEAERFISAWFRLNPEIPEWHRRISNQLRDTRQVRNAFGYRRFFFDRLEDCLPEAVAWIPQSTIGIVINKALCNIAEALPQVELLLQVHDSLVMQTLTTKVHEVIPLIERYSLIPIPYPEPLIIPVGFKTSEVSWGQCKDYVRPQ